MINKIDNLISTVENGLFAVLGEAPKPARRSAKAVSRKAVRRKPAKKKVRKRRK